MSNSTTPWVIEKTIYAKRVKVSNEQMRDVFRLEIETHLQKHPNYVFLKIGKPVENPDRSQTYRIYFQPKPRTNEASSEK